MLDVRRNDPGRRAGVPVCESSSGAGRGRDGATEVSVTGSLYRVGCSRLPVADGTLRRMDDLFGPYERTRARVCTLLLDATPAELARTVPACPAWSVHDLGAHLAGTPAELAAGNFPSGNVAAWVQAIVDTRRDTEMRTLVDEWCAFDGFIESMMRGSGALLFGDIAVHEHDLRAALDRPDHAAMEVDAVVSFTVGSFAAPARDAGLGAIVVEHDGRTWRSHDVDAGWTLRVEPWAAVRALSSRRTADEIRALPADGDAAPYVALIDAHLPLPAQSLGE